MSGGLLSIFGQQQAPAGAGGFDPDDIARLLQASGGRLGIGTFLGLGDPQAAPPYGAGPIPNASPDDMRRGIVRTPFDPADSAGLFQPVRGVGQVDPSGRGTGPVDQRRPPTAMTEADTQQMERAMASPQDLAALGGSPLDRLLYDRGGMGGGPNSFTGLVDPYGSRAVPLPPARPSADDLMAPATTGAVPSQQPPAGVGGLPGVNPQAAAARRGTDQSPVAAPTPVDGFDPLTGQVTSGAPRPIGAPQAVAQGTTLPQVAPGQSPMMQRFLDGSGISRNIGPQPGASLGDILKGIVTSPGFGDSMLAFGSGLLSARGSEGWSRAFDNMSKVNQRTDAQQLQNFKIAQQIDTQNATYSHLVNNLKLDPTTARAAMLNPTLLNSVLSQQNRAPTTIDRDGFRYLVPPNGANDPSTWQKVGAVNGPQPGFEANPDVPGGQRPITGSSADPAYRGAVAGAEAKAKNEAAPDKPIQMRPGAVLLDSNTYKPVYEAPGNKPAGFETEDKLRTEFSKQLGTFAQVHDGYGRIIAATKQRQDNPGAVSPAADIGLIFGYMKMLDPGSVVREGEYATAKNAAGVPERVLNAYNKTLNGEFLTDRQRQDFIGQADSLYGTARKTAEGVATRYRGLASQYNVDPDRSVYLPEAPTPPRLGQQGQGQGQQGGQSSAAATRYHDLRRGGMSQADAYARMHAEGF